jgi:hypothetical protein
VSQLLVDRWTDANRVFLCADRRYYPSWKPVVLRNSKRVIKKRNCGGERKEIVLLLVMNFARAMFHDDTPFVWVFIFHVTPGREKEGT